MIGGVNFPQSNAILWDSEMQTRCLRGPTAGAHGTNGRAPDAGSDYPRTGLQTNCLGGPATGAHEANGRAPESGSGYALTGLEAIYRVLADMLFREN